MIFYIVFSLVITQRLVELFVARRNKQLLFAQGAYEVGAKHYPFMLALHIGFFVSLLVEVIFSNLTPSPYFSLLLLLFLVVQSLRIWCIASLGKFWNTKIIVLPGMKTVAKGPYKFIRHPNYVIVSLEIILLPLLFQAFITAVLFTVLNLWMLSVRVPIEESALREACVSAK